MDLFSLHNKVALVFGGNGYLGKQLCSSLLDYGATVFSCDINVTESKETKALHRKYPKQFRMIQIDAAKKEDLTKLRNDIIGHTKRVDILVNSTTMKGEDFYQPYEDVSLEGWNIGLLGNLTIPFLTIQTFIPIMKKQQNGSIINIASHYGIVGNDQRIYIGADLHKHYSKSDRKEKERIFSHGVYNAAKAGIINLTRYLAAYYGEYNIRVNCISPGGIYRKNWENETFTKQYSERVPLGRRGNPDELNGALIFLASDASSYITGHNLVVDGGYTIW